MPSASPPAKLRILLIGVQRLLCDALHAMIEADAECTVVGKTTYIDEALTLFLSVRPCLILADLDLRNGINVQLIEQLSQFTAGIPLVLITFHTKPELLRQLLPLNIQACLAKDIEGSELIMTLKLSKNGGGKKFCHLRLSTA